MVFENVCLSIRTTGMPDNVPLKLTNTFWVWYTHGCLQSGPDLPVALFTGEDNSEGIGSSAQTGLIFFSDLITAGGGFKYIQRTPPTSAPGFFSFRNITMEDAKDLFEITEDCASCGAAPFSMDSLEFDNVSSADSLCPNCSVINMNAPNLRLSGVTITRSANKTAITVNSGTLADYQILGCAYWCGTAVVDGNGNPVWHYRDRVRLSGGQATLTFAPVFFEGSNPPVCVVNDETTPNGARVVATMTNMTITGGYFDVVDYWCDPAPQPLPPH